ncbi:hypothetical protein CMV_028917 [Castanea mollissima]|uniref:Uncharacterized protein n=1 Tax=Castanea mollissima TaxID=60419 RepID=A0A8J4Q7U6_9ROSI|nr:hypothetical protein CMV_028917 [Castanea mollissima]
MALQERRKRHIYRRGQTAKQDWSSKTKQGKQEKNTESLGTPRILEATASASAATATSSVLLLLQVVLFCARLCL